MTEPDLGTMTVSEFNEYILQFPSYFRKKLKKVRDIQRWSCMSQFNNEWRQLRPHVKRGEEDAAWCDMVKRLQNGQAFPLILDRWDFRSKKVLDNVAVS